MRTACLGGALLALTVSAGAAPHPFAALADRAADELVRIAAGRAIQVDVPIERTGMAGAADLHALIEARLRDRGVAARSGPRVRLSSVLGRSATRIRLAGRVTAEPAGMLVDVLAVSAEADPDLIDLVALPRPPPGTVTVLSSSVSAPLRGRVLDVAFIDDERLVLLMEDEVALHQRRGDALARLDHRPLSVSTVVRAPAGVLVAAGREAAFWATTNLDEGAVLFTIDGERLHEIQRAAALPWPGSAQGARFRPATNLIEVAVPGLGSGPHLRAGAGETAWAIAPDGRFGIGRGWSDARVGSAAAELWKGVWIASGAKPPGPADELLVLRAAGGAPSVAATFPVGGNITAVGARARGARALVAAAVVEDGAHRLVLMEVAREGP